MIDNILYEDVTGLILDINVSNAGSVNNILYTDVRGIMQNISLNNTGTINNILFADNLLEVLPLSTAEIGFGYSS